MTPSTSPRSIPAAVQGLIEGLVRAGLTPPQGDTVAVLGRLVLALHGYHPEAVQRGHWILQAALAQDAERGTRSTWPDDAAVVRACYQGSLTSDRSSHHRAMREQLIEEGGTPGYGDVLAQGMRRYRPALGGAR